MLPPPAPVVTITEDGGGLVDAFAARVLDYRDAGTLVRIEGWCASACTMLAGLPRANVCVGRDAELGFHQSYIPRDPAHVDPKRDVFSRSAEGTQQLWRFYPRRVRDWITRHGGLSARMLSLKGAALRRLFHTCED